MCVKCQEGENPQNCFTLLALSCSPFFSVQKDGALESSYPVLIKKIYKKLKALSLLNKTCELATFKIYVLCNIIYAKISRIRFKILANRPLRNR